MKSTLSSNKQKKKKLQHLIWCITTLHSVDFSSVPPFCDQLRILICLRLSVSPTGRWCWSCCSSRRPQTWRTARAASRCTWPPGGGTWTSSASSSTTDPRTAESTNRWGPPENPEITPPQARERTEKCLMTRRCLRTRKSFGPLWT